MKKYITYQFNSFEKPVKLPVYTANEIGLVYREAAKKVRFNGGDALARDFEKKAEELYDLYHSEPS